MSIAVIPKAIMPDGEIVQPIYIKSLTELKKHYETFFTYAKSNPMVAFDTDWGYDSFAKRLNITRLKLCNLDDICLIIDLASPTVRDFVAASSLFASKRIRFVGVDISRDLQKLKEDYGIEIRNAVDLSVIASDCDWYDLKHSESCLYEPCEFWGDYEVKFPYVFETKNKKIPRHFCELPLMSALFAGMVYSPAMMKNDHELHATPAYVALKIGMKLFNIS